MDEQEDLDFKIVQAKEKCYFIDKITKIVEQTQTQEQAHNLFIQVKEYIKQMKELTKQINIELQNEQKYPLLNEAILKNWKMDIASKENDLAKIFINRQCNSVTEVLELAEDFLQNKTDDFWLAIKKLDPKEKALNFNNCNSISTLYDLIQIIKNNDYDNSKEIVEDILKVAESNNFIKSIFKIEQNKENTFYAMISTNEILKIEYLKTNTEKLKVLNITETFVKCIDKEIKGE